jgi:hypothetical protein
MKNVIKELIDSKTSFAMCIGVNELKLNKGSYSTSDYFVIVHKSKLTFSVDKDGNTIYDRGRLSMENKYSFSKSIHRDDVYEKTLDSSDIVYFKSINDSFTKVQHDSDGRVYELKSNPFRDSLHHKS